MTQRRPRPEAPGPLEGYAARFDDLFGYVNLICPTFSFDLGPPWDRSADGSSPLIWLHVGVPGSGGRWWSDSSFGQVPGMWSGTPASASSTAW